MSSVSGQETYSYPALLLILFLQARLIWKDSSDLGKKDARQSNKFTQAHVYYQSPSKRCQIGTIVWGRQAITPDIRKNLKATWQESLVLIKILL